MSAEQFAKIVTGQETPSSTAQWLAFVMDKYGPWALIGVAASFFYHDLREDKEKLLEAYRESSAAMHEFSKSVDALSNAVKGQQDSIDRAHRRATN